MALAVGGVWRNVGWGRIPHCASWVGGLHRFWPTLLVLLTGRRPGALWRFVIFGAALDAVRGTWVFGGYGFDPWSRLLLSNDGLAQWLSVFGPWIGSALVLGFFALPWRWSVGGVFSCVLIGSMLRPEPVESGLIFDSCRPTFPKTFEPAGQPSDGSLTSRSFFLPVLLGHRWIW